MVTKLDPIVNKIGKFILAIIPAIGCVMLVVSLTHVFCRYVLGSSLTWSEEFLKITLVWFCMLSATVISQSREHIGIVIFKEMMPKKIQKMCEYFSQFLMLAASILVCIVGIVLLIKTAGQTTPALRWPIGIGYSAVPISFGLMAFYEVRNLWADIKSKKAEA